jgi:hypothetical protein
MKNYLISYDLVHPGRNYQSLFDAIKAIANGWCHCLESVWIIGNSGPAASIRDSLQRHIDSNDKLIVVELGKDWASYNLGHDIAKWLERL